MRSSLSKLSVDWADSSTPPPSMSSATHDVPLSDAGASAGPRAAPEGDAGWHAERATQNTAAKIRDIGLTVSSSIPRVLEQENLDLGPEHLRVSVAHQRALAGATRRDTMPRT